MKNNHWKNFGAYLALMGMLSSCSTGPIKRFLADEDYSPQTAYEAWGTLNHSATSYQAQALFVEDGVTVPGRTSGITWGAEKEASSSLLTHIMGPNTENFKIGLSRLSGDSKKEFLKDFLSNYVKDVNGYRTYKNDDGVKVDLASDVKDAEGNPKVIDLTEIKQIDFENATLEQLEDGMNKFISQTDGRPLSFIKPSVRMKMFNGGLPGLSGNMFKEGTSPRPNYNAWVPNFGKAEKYIIDAHAHHGGSAGGWELRFVPLDTYGEFEEMVAWFRNELKQTIKDPVTLEKKVKLFQAPGHQRMVFNAHRNLPEAKLSELYRMIQTYIVVKGIQGNTKIEFANYKSVHDDRTLANLHPASHHNRGVIRIEGSRWGQGTHGIEFRAGTKDLNAARFYQTVLAARVAANDFSGLADIGDYKLIDSSFNSAESISSRYDIDIETVRKAKRVLSEIGVKDSYQIQFWNWTDEGIPFIGSAKRKQIKSHTRDYIKQVAALDGTVSGEQKKEAARQIGRGWMSSSRIWQDLENYMKPKRNFDLAEDIAKFDPPSGRNFVRNAVNVNDVDLGIEFSGKFPLMVRGDFSKERLDDGKKAWIQTKVDLSPEEREAYIKSVAADLKESLGGTEGPFKIEDQDGHGHGLDVAYEIRDAQNRKWMVEWDGIGRTYTPDGEIIDGSARGGSIELITPKFTPDTKEINAVFEAFEKNNILPQLQGGGGHINVDLAAFDGNPKALARFLTIFHEHRGIISLMFQHINRMHTSEGIPISDTLSRELKNFNGSETELKQLLYNEKYFNTKFGRKTRYLQIDMSAYMQDVIPGEFLTKDFDIANPTVDWRRQFRAHPKIRKMEFRMFNAPRDAYESALMIKLVRGIMSKALNETGELSGKVQEVNHMGYLEDTNKAMDDLKKLTDDLGLDINDYRPAVAEGLAETQKASRSVFFRPLEERLAINPPQRGWGQALDTARTEEQLFHSEDKEWVRGPADEQNTMTNEHRIRASREGMEMRNNIVPAREMPGEFVKTESCAELIDSVL